jgi:C4-dicarboxylate-specific signal transduction histidine kinase
MRLRSELNALSRAGPDVSAARQTRAWPRVIAPFALALAWPLCASPLASAATPQSVLVLYSFGRLLPANLEGDRGLRETFAKRPDIPVRVSVEYLDNLAFSGDDYEQTFVTYLRNKYASVPPKVMIVAADEAMDFVLRHRGNLFPQVPILYMNVTDEYLDTLPAVPADVVGTMVNFDFAGTIEQALRWHPRTKKVVFVTGAGVWDLQWERRLRLLGAQLRHGLTVDFLAALPEDELRRRLGELEPHTIVVTPGFFADGAGRETAPRESAALIAAASPVPVYGFYSTQLGTGIVGGRMSSFEAVGRLGAKTALSLLEGVDPADVRPPRYMPTAMQVDWRQLERWKIAEKDLPPDTVTWFREPTLWESNRDLVILSAAVMLLQAGLIGALLLERRRRRRILAALARSEKRMRLAAQAASLSTWIYDDRGDGRYPAQADGRPLAQEYEAAPMVDFRETLTRVSRQDLPAVEAALRQALDSQGEFDVAYRVDLADGEHRWQSARGGVDPSRTERLMGVVIDITQRKQAEAQMEHDRAALFHMSRVSMLGQLSAAIAHQLNQPLASILANAEAAKQILGREPVDLRELGEICHDIILDDHRAADVIRRLGALFRREASKFEPLDLNDLVRESLALIQSGVTTRQATVSTNLAPDFPLVSGDRVQLQQVLLNLVINAADAMAQACVGAHEITISTAAAGEVVELCVADRGPGIAPEVQDRLFEPFWSTREGGMGMGLAICRSIAIAHEGSLTASNRPQGGATFCMTLPILVPQ